MNIVVTWPKSRPLSSYLAELARAEREGEVAYYRVGNGWPNTHPNDRCYHVHDGAVRGWLRVDEVIEMGIGARRPTDSVTDEEFRPGIYVVREPLWYPSDPISMAGFQGFRYAERTKPPLSGVSAALTNLGIKS